MDKKDKNRPVIVYSGNYTQALMIRSFLESAGIQAFVQDEMSGSLAPFATSPAGVGSVKVIVAERDLEEAERMIDEFFSEEE